MAELAGSMCAPWPPVPPPDARAHSEFGTEGSVKVRNVAEAALQRDVHDLSKLGPQSDGSALKPHSQKILVRRDARYALEGSEEMVRTQPRFAGKRAQIVVTVRIAFDGPHHTCNSSVCPWTGPARLLPESAIELDSPGR